MAKKAQAAAGGQVAIRGFLIQTLIALLDALDKPQTWLSVTLEPNVDSDKVDVLFEFPDRVKAIQVKSSKNPFSKADIERWAGELEAWNKADDYELILIGNLASAAVAKVTLVGQVEVPPPKNLDLGAFKEQAAHRLDKFLRDHGLPCGAAHSREMLAGALAEELATLSTRGTALTYDDLVDLFKKWILPRQASLTGRRELDPRKYLQDLKEKTGFIDIRGLQVSKERAHRFPIEELFISLTTTRLPNRPEQVGKKPRRHPDDKDTLGGSRAVPLHEALDHDRLIVVGDPGAGKTTFLRRVAHALCEQKGGQLLGIKDRTFPIFLRVADLAQHLQRPTHAAPPPASQDAASWLPHYLAAAGVDHGWGLDYAFFRRQLDEGLATVMLDGLDEAPNRVVRERIARLIENAVQTYGKCRFVVSTRPAAYTGEALLPGFAHATIDPLSDDAVAAFLGRWCGALYPESKTQAAAQQRELLEALRAKPAIRRMARNPVMLTALAVLHWNEHTLPEQRADLYESVLRWLSRAREERPEREKADRTVELLRELALAMQNHPDGMRLQVSRRWAAEMLAKEWADPVDQRALGRAEAFLEAEELDSGIIVGRGSDLQFWHRSFQEFLAARAIAARPEAQQDELLWEPPDRPRLYAPEWREVMLLLAGILHKQGREKVDNLFHKVLDRLGKNASLADEARTAGLLGGMLRDLAPVAYSPRRKQYDELLHRVQAIFDPARSASVPIETRIAAGDALGQAGVNRLDPRRPEYWVTIPAGTFRMGAQKIDANQPNFDNEANDGDGTVREVTVPAFKIGRYPVTVGQFEQFFEDDGYTQRRFWDAGGCGAATEPAHWDEQRPYSSRPVVGVSWHEAMAFCAWAELRLPTEAEWEFAARGTEARKFPWGHEAADSSRLNFKGEVGHVTPVGIYPLGNTPEGICDMAGNVWEWCADYYDQEKPEQGLVLRGGAWDYVAEFCRPAVRSRNAPEVGNYYVQEIRLVNVGFRVALSLAPRTVTA
jgi:formylglycine-generating enzyme required for sulfatase activity